VVFHAVVFKLLVWCGAEGYVSGLQDAAASCKPQAIRSAIKTSVASSWHFISTYYAGSVQRQLFTDVLRRTIGPIFKGQEIKREDRARLKLTHTVFLFGTLSIV